MLKTHGKAVAEHVASFEARQVDEIEKLVQRLGIVCDFEKTRITDVCLYDSGRDKINSDLDRLAKADMSTVHSIQYHAGGEAEKVSSFKWRCAALIAEHRAN